MGHGAGIPFSVSIASNVTLSSALDLGRVWNNVYLRVPTMASGDIYIQASPDNSAAFVRICRPQGNTATVHTDFLIGSAVTQRIVPIPIAGCRYIKIESSSGTTQVTTTFQVICGD